jgi:hypothetical protein
MKVKSQIPASSYDNVGEVFAEKQRLFGTLVRLL